jgi:hypothetical protein
MPDQKHYKYEGHAVLETNPKITIDEASFLMPIQVNYTLNSNKTSVFGYVDWKKKKAYFPGLVHEAKLAEELFKHLNIELVVERDFSAPQEVVEKAENAHFDFDMMYASKVGKSNE